MARPTGYSEELGAEICARIADGKSVAEIGRQADMPCEKTIWRWLREQEAFRQLYVEACGWRGDVLVDQALEASTRTLRRARAGKAGKAEVAAARLQVDTLIKRAAQLAPKKYGPLLRLAGQDGDALPLIIRRERPITRL